MNLLHGSDTATGEATTQLLRYRLAVITVFLLALFSAGVGGRAWHDHLAHRGDEVQSPR